MNQKELIEQRLSQLGMSWYTLAKETGLHQHTLYKIKQGRIQARRTDILEPIAEVIGVSPDYLAVIGNHIPEDIHKGIIDHPELIPMLRNLIAKIEARTV